MNEININIIHSPIVFNFSKIAPIDVHESVLLLVRRAPAREVSHTQSTRTLPKKVEEKKKRKEMNFSNRNLISIV